MKDVRLYVEKDKKTNLIILMNQIEEMVYNLLPQFERYEGQVRFTQGFDEPIPTSASTARKTTE